MSGAVTAGDLSTRLVLEAVSRTSDGGGGASVEWEAVAEVWACVRATGGSEALTLDRVAGRLRHEIVIRYRSDVTPQMRFREGTRIYDIVAVYDPDRHRRWLTCLVEERDL